MEKDDEKVNKSVGNCSHVLPSISGDDGDEMKAETAAKERAHVNFKDPMKGTENPVSPPAPPLRCHVFRTIPPWLDKKGRRGILRHNWSRDHTFL